MTDPDQSTSRQERFATGMSRYREVYGEEATVFGPGEAAFFDIMIEQLFAEVWTRPGLDIPSRRLLTMGVLAAQAKYDVLSLQFARALKTGEFTEEQVRETVIQLVPYVGYPSSGSLFQAGETAIAQHREASAENP